jgi:hypothetical protein
LNPHRRGRPRAVQFKGLYPKCRDGPS